MERLPARKRARLGGYDYSSVGAYFVTVCVKDGHEMLGEVVHPIVGDAPPRVPHCALTEYGIFVDAQIQKISSIYSYVFVGNYTVMPNHIHMLITIADSASSQTDSGMRQKTEGGTHQKMEGGTRQKTEGGTRGGTSPTKAGIPRIIQSLKSMSTKQFGFNIWQRSYHDHIIRTEEEYQKISQYIDENPARWAEDCYYTKIETARSN